MSARRRLWLLFGGLALVSAAILASAAWLATSGRAPPSLCWSGAALMLIAAQAGVWAVLDRSWLQPRQALAREIRLLLHANPERPLELPEGHGLGELADAIEALADDWRRRRAEHDAALAGALARASEQQRRLEAVLRDLSDGLIACSADRRILLFNDAALRMFGGNPDLGLDRPLDRLIAPEPIAHAFELLCEDLGGDRPSPAAEERVEFVCATADGARLLRSRMALIHGQDGAASGFVLDLVDATAQLERRERQGTRLRELVQAQRAPAAALRAAAEVLAGPDALPAAERAAFLGVLERESATLSAQVEALAGAAEELTAGDWPSADLYSADLVRWVNRRLARAAEPLTLTLTAVGPGLWLHGDGYHLSLLLARLARSIRQATGAPGLDLEVEHQGRRIAVDLVWQGAPLALATLEAWLDEPLEPEAHGARRLRDVLRRHDSEIWSQAHRRAGYALVRLPLPGATRPQQARPHPAQPLPPRPEFYDFDLLARVRQPSSLLARPLGEVGYVVFDTETTGLDPRSGDRIVQLAGVRIVNRRLLTGEVFDALVDPGRPIPKASIRFHGVTEAMVRGRPPLEIVLPQFHKFAEGAVLVAHNAAFDLAFLRREEERLGLRFDQPVLDTLLLSAVVHDHLGEHSLDAIAARLGIAPTRRHQALGDAICTGQVFLRLLDLLEAQGVHTLGDALAVAERAVALRRRLAAEFGTPPAHDLRRAGHA